MWSWHGWVQGTGERYYEIGKVCEVPVDQITAQRLRKNVWTLCWIGWKHLLRKGKEKETDVSRVSLQCQTKTMYISAMHSIRQSIHSWKTSLCSKSPVKSNSFKKLKKKNKVKGDIQNICNFISKTLTKAIKTHTKY